MSEAKPLSAERRIEIEQLADKHFHLINDDVDEAIRDALAAEQYWREKAEADPTCWCGLCDGCGVEIESDPYSTLHRANCDWIEAIEAKRALEAKRV